MSFRVTGLPLTRFSSLFSMTDEELAAHHAVRVVADKKPGFPCRVSLQDAEPGESLILVNYEHLAVASPYRSRHAIYVREAARDRTPAINEIPAVLRARLLSVRGFDNTGMMVAADVIPGAEVETLIERLLEDTNVEYLHVHNARPGCYAARIDRA